MTLSWDPRPAIGVVLATMGYPLSVEKRVVIGSLPCTDGVLCKTFHAGTKYEGNQLVTNGGRVLCVTSLGDDYQGAQQKVYEEVRKIHWPNLYYRQDIGDRAFAK